ncbi:ABC transporter ATP-binding protein [Paenibacillus sp. HJGM_3]|uniref:ABC transporter ATP-binding protein n=1 Tax=Paenibacillus sp. HJGM_3 TaxID=3379816 RepID=UPI00385C6F3D
MDAAATVVELRHITKRFPGIVANDSISLTLLKGEIHALLGENGAGKSTLMNILFGLYQPDEGQILIHNREVAIDSPNRAIELGIGMVHQHFKLVQPFTVTENIILGMEPKAGVTINYRAAAAQVAELSRRYGLKVDPDSRVDRISVGMQQRVEILKVLYRGADILIFDEPTAVLTPQEIAELMAILRNLAAEGKSIILITHKLKEIMEIADRVTIIRRGKIIDTVRKVETNPNMLAEKMVGRGVSFKVSKTKAQPGEPVLKVSGLRTAGGRGASALKDMSFEVRAGEILGIAGVDGNGQKELIEALTGLGSVESGSIKLRGAELTGRSPRTISEAGISHIPEDRHKHGLVLDFGMNENMVLSTYFRPIYTRGPLLNYETIDKHAAKLIEEFDVRTPSIYTKGRALSGGNQQKAIIAREIDKNPDLLLAVQPTRGLDVGAIEFVHRRLIEQRNQGKAVLLVSFEMDEILNVSDRIAVIYDGRLIGIVDPDETNDRELGLMMAGTAIHGDDTGRGA